MMDSTPITGCSGCASSGGRSVCPHHGLSRATTASPPPELRWVTDHEATVLERLNKIVRLLESIEYHVRTGR